MNIYLFCLTLFFACTPLCAREMFDIMVYDQKGRRVQEVEAGQPFRLKITIEDASRAASNVIIHGLAPLHILTSVCRMTQVNGLSLVTHERQLRADAPGVYTLGPVEYNDNGVTYKSSTVQLKVVPATNKPAAQDDEADDKQLAFLELSLDKKVVYIGEKVTCTLTLHFISNELALGSLNQPQFDGVWHIAEQIEEARGKKEINGHEYDVLVLQWQMCPEKTGDITIPAFGADFLQEMPAHAFPFGMGMFSQRTMNTKRVYSNACTVKVLPLPASKVPAQAVGTFTDFVARVNQAALKAGDAINLTLTLRGDADFERISYPHLSDMPDALKWYDSKQTRQKDGIQFEFVVQALEPGSWEIPAQTFTYFDTKSHTYKTLSSAPLLIKVQQQAAAPALKAPAVPEEKPVLVEQQVPSVAPAIAPLQLDLLEQAATYKMEWWLFMLVMGVFFFIGMLPVVTRSYVRRIRSNLRYYAYKKAYTDAHKQLRIARTNNDGRGIYTLMIELCAARLKVPRESLTHHAIEDALRAHGMDHHAIQEWRQFIEECAQYAFTPVAFDPHIFDRAQRMLGQLKGIL